ncbi:MAG: porin [Aquabacterium sp.]|nr:MAG: porin [Aquabacterium sp.]
MNRLSLTAAALLGIASILPAAAQSSITLYGVVDVSVESVKGTDTLTRISSGNLNTSRLGFKGIEDLGSGLTAKFVLESAISADTGANGGGSARFWDRAAWVGLGSGFGELRLGRIDSALGLTADKIGTQAYDDLRLAGTRAANNYRRIDNTVTYILPASLFSGLTGQLQYSTGAVGYASTGAVSATTAGTESTAKAGRAWSANLGYTVGPFAAEAAYLVSRDENSVQAGNQKAKAGIVLASWDFGVVKATGYYSGESQLGGANRLAVWGLKFGIPVTPAFVLTPGYSRSTGTTLAGGDDDKVNIFSLKGVYSVSKRTAIYVWFDHISNGDAATKGIVTTAAGENGRGLALGVRHAF